MIKGQIVYLKPGVNEARHNAAIREGIVKIVGRKYITVSIERDEYKFHIDTLREVTSYTPSYYLYESKQQIVDEAEYTRLSQSIRKTIEYCSKQDLSLEQLRQIKAIIEGVLIWNAQ